MTANAAHPIYSVGSTCFRALEYVVWFCFALCSITASYGQTMPPSSLDLPVKIQASLDKAQKTIAVKVTNSGKAPVCISLTSLANPDLLYVIAPIKATPDHDSVAKAGTASIGIGSFQVIRAIEEEILYPVSVLIVELAPGKSYETKVDIADIYKKYIEPIVKTKNEPLTIKVKLQFLNMLFPDTKSNKRDELRDSMQIFHTPWVFFES